MAAPWARRLRHHRDALQPPAGAAPGAQPAAAEEETFLSEPVLSERDLELWEERGYTVVRGAASKEDCDAVVEHICQALGMSRDDPESWHKLGGPGALTEDGEVSWDMEKATPIHHAVPVQNAQAQWNIRTSPRVHAAFAQIYGTHRLWCNPTGVVTMKPPWRKERLSFTHICHEGQMPWFGLGDALPMHWDVSPESFVDGGYPGTFEAPAPAPSFSLPTCSYRPPNCIAFLMLNDRTEFGGQTSCVPRFHRYFNRWAASASAQPEIERMHRPESRHHPDMANVLSSLDEVFEPEEGRAEIVVPPGNAGDLVILDGYMPHGSGKNTMSTPRFTMWVTSSPVPDDPDERARQAAARVEAFEEQAGWVPLEERGRLPSLTPLGRRVLGAEPW